MAHLQSTNKRAICYIDGFNLYFGSMKKRWREYKWLDLYEFGKSLNRQYNVEHVKYFTAKVKPDHLNREIHIRQELYLRALATISEITVIHGHYSKHKKRLPLAFEPSWFTKVIKFEEKGSDVNLAVHAVADGFNDKYDLAIIVSNDSDLVEPIRIITQELRKNVEVFSPHSNASAALAKWASSQKKIRKHHLADHQFPEKMNDKHGILEKPHKWKVVENKDGTETDDDSGSVANNSSKPSLMELLKFYYRGFRKDYFTRSNR